MTTSGASEAWHVLLGPLPPGARPARSPVAPPELAGKAEAGLIAGWENLVLHISAGAAGLRVVQVVLDEHGQPISGSDHVLFRSEPVRGVGSRAGAAHIRQESIGGRFETDGTFCGTCWLITGPEPPEGEEPRWEMAPREPSPDEVLALRTLVKVLLERDAGELKGA